MARCAWVWPGWAGYRGRTKGTVCTAMGPIQCPRGRNLESVIVPSTPRRLSIAHSPADNSGKERKKYGLVYQTYCLSSSSLCAVSYQQSGESTRQAYCEAHSYAVKGWNRIGAIRGLATINVPVVPLPARGIQASHFPSLSRSIICKMQKRIPAITIVSPASVTGFVWLDTETSLLVVCGHDGDLCHEGNVQIGKQSCI